MSCVSFGQWSGLAGMAQQKVITGEGAGQSRARLTASGPVTIKRNKLTQKDLLSNTRR